MPDQYGANRSMPDCTVIPVLTYPDVSVAVEWLCRVFDFGIRWQIGEHRAQLSIGDGAIAITVAPQDETNPDSMMVRVSDIDAHYERTRQRGGRVLSPPIDHPYGERQYTVADHSGRSWTFSATIADVAPEDWGAHIPTPSEGG